MVRRPAITRELAGAPITIGRSRIGRPHRAGRRRPHPPIVTEHSTKRVGSSKRFWLTCLRPAAAAIALRERQRPAGDVVHLR